LIECNLFLFIETMARHANRTYNVFPLKSNCTRNRMNIKYDLLYENLVQPKFVVINSSNVLVCARSNNLVMKNVKLSWNFVIIFCTCFRCRLLLSLYLYIGDFYFKNIQLTCFFLWTKTRAINIIVFYLIFEIFDEMNQSW
jgi:hypothetical protein